LSRECPGLMSAARALAPYAGRANVKTASFGVNT
jgi:hypothetical protein